MIKKTKTVGQILLYLEAFNLYTLKPRPIRGRSITLTNQREKFTVSLVVYCIRTRKNRFHVKKKKKRTLGWMVAIQTSKK